MTEFNEEKLKQVERDAYLYFRRNEDKFEEIAEILTKPRSNLTLINDFFTRKILI